MTAPNSTPPSRTTTPPGLSYRKLFAATTISNLGDGMAVIAYPWLALAITRNPLLIALVLVAQRLPWSVFTLPAGVITDRVDRRRAMVTMDMLRFALTLFVGRRWGHCCWSWRAGRRAIPVHRAGLRLGDRRSGRRAGCTVASRRLGSGTCLAIALGTPVVVSVAVGLSSSWVLVMLFTGIGAFLTSGWNVITVSLRQSIIPPHLLGRVNSVYRFFAWGMMPIGAALGGLIVAVIGATNSRFTGLHVVWFADAAIHLGLFIFGRNKLTTAKIEAARAAGAMNVAPATPVTN